MTPPTFSADFETGDLRQWDGRDQLCCVHSSEVVTRPVRDGDFAVRIHLEKSDPEVSGSHRAELQKFGLGRAGEEWWYELFLFVPSAWKSDPGFPETVVQWQKRTGSGEWGSPPLEIAVDGNRWYVAVRHNSDPDGRSTYRWDRRWSTALDRGRWTRWVVHVRWGWKDAQNPLLEIWKSGEPVVEGYRGFNSYRSRDAHFLKAGVYKWSWGRGGESRTRERTLYIDSVRAWRVDSSRASTGGHAKRRAGGDGRS
jgi:hypothetical protein